MKRQELIRDLREMGLVQKKSDYYGMEQIVLLLEDVFNEQLSEQKEKGRFQHHLLESINSVDFVQRVLNDKDLMCTEEYAVLSRYVNLGSHRQRVARFLEGKTLSESFPSGYLRVGSEHFDLMIPSGSTKQNVQVAIFEHEEEFNPDMMNYQMKLSGIFFLYGQEKENLQSEIVKMLTGPYFVYTYEGYIAFVRTNV